MSELPVQGVTAMDHTADVGLEIEAPDQGELLARAGLGLAWLLAEAPAPDVSEERALEVEAEDAPALLRAWLRELLHWHDDAGVLPASFRVERARGGRARAVVRCGVPEREPIREIKGVTLHRLAAEPRGTGWWGRVVFDV